MTLVRAGERGVDFSFARPPAHRLLELGYTFVVGYISVPPASPAKNISKQECDAYVAAGLKVLLVWEQNAARPNLGASYGTMDGASAKRLARDLGYPVDVPILIADDTNTTAANLAAHEAYMRAFAVTAAPYPVGIYGDTDILGACAGLWRIGWLPNAWSWSGRSRADAEAKAKALGVHVLQRKGFYIDDVWAVDPNDVINPFPAWGLGQDSQPEVEGDMAYIVTNSETRNGEDPLHAKFLVREEGDLVPQSGTDLKARGIVNALTLGIPLTNAELDEMGTYTPGAGGTVDQVARDEAAHANEGLTRVASTISDIRMGGQRIADAGGH